MVENMSKMGVKPTVATYTILIEEMLKEGDFDHANRVFNQMVSFGHKPDVYTYTAFIHTYCTSGNVKEAEGMMARMIEAGVMPDSLTYTLLISAYERLGLTYDAFNVLKRMLDAGCDPSHRTYSFLIRHLSKIKLMNENSHLEQLDLVQSVTFFNAADVWKIMQLETALELFEKMMEHGCTPGVNTYAKLIIGVCKVGRWGVANSLFNHMIERGLVPNEDIYNALLSCCCELRMLSSAARLVEAMMEHGHLPLLESCKLLLCGLYDEGENEKAKAVFVHLLLCGYNYDEVAWKILIDGLLKSGLADRCSELLSVMEKRGCQIDPLTYTKLIEGLDGSHGT